jgi:hypothetical protein
LERQEYFISSHLENEVGLLSQIEIGKLIILVFKRERTILVGYKYSVLRKILEIKGQEIAPDWRQLNNEELHNFHAYIKV